MQIAINIDGQFRAMTGIQHSIDSLIHHLYLNQAKEGGSKHEITAFASVLPHQADVEAFAAQNPGTFEWRNLPQARFDLAGGAPAQSLVPARFEREHPWLSNKLREQERKLRRKPGSGAGERVQKYDLFHCPEPGEGEMHFLNYKPKKEIATLYDIATRKFQSIYSVGAIEKWETYFRYIADRCVHAVAISEATKQDCMEAFKMPSEKITVTPLAARSSTYQIPDGPHRRAILDTWDLSADTPFVLYGGTLEPRKNLHKLVKAFSNVVREYKTLPHKLVLAGGNWERLDIELRIYALECGIPGRVITTGYVTNEQLNALMSACEAFAYVSRYEGFGMPPLEAMTCGAPVITSNVSSLPEVAGEAGILVDPQSVEEIAAALHLLMTNPTENARRRELSLAQAKEFTWERTARLTMEAYEKAAAS